MKCSNCQKEFSEGRFCPSCGFDNLAPKENVTQKTCPACGKEIKHGHFCPACGCDVDHPEATDKSQALYKTCKNCGANMTHERFCLSCGYDNSKMAFHGNGPRGMKWYNFLIWFSLFAAAITALYNFSYYFSVYWSTLIYKDLDDVFPNIEASEIAIIALSSLIVLAIAFFAFGAFALFTRHKLVKYQADAPRCVVALYVASAGLALDQLIISILMEMPVGSYVISIITALILAVLNYNYFENRSDLFIN